jgi:hypothetical protein
MMMLNKKALLSTQRPASSTRASIKTQAQAKPALKLYYFDIP